MPLADTLNELSTLTQIQHTKIMDALAAQVQASNIANAHAAILQALPTPDARAAFNAHDWAGLGNILGTSATELKDQLYGKTITDGNFDPRALSEGINTLFSGKDSGQLAKAAFEKTAIDAAPTLFEPGALSRAFVASSLTGMGPGDLAASNLIASDPSLVKQKAAIDAGVAIPAAVKAQIAEQASATTAQVGAQNFRTRADLEAAILAQVSENQRAAMSGKGAKNNQDLEWVKLMNSTASDLGKGGLDPVTQVSKIAIFNKAVMKLVESGAFPESYAKPREQGGFLVDPKSPDAPGAVIGLAKLLMNLQQKQ